MKGNKSEGKIQRDHSEITTLILVFLNYA